MTYSAARSKIVDLVEAAVPTINPYGLRASFKESPGASQDFAVDGRFFSLFGVADDVRNPLKSRRRRVCALELRVFYPLLRDRRTLDLVLRADHQVVGDALLDVSSWSSSTSGIISVEQAGGALIMHADVEAADQHVEHVYRFDLEYLSD